MIKYKCYLKANKTWKINHSRAGEVLENQKIMVILSENRKRRSLSMK